MKKTGAIICLQLLFLLCPAQRMELKELTAILDIPVNRLDNILHKKGFRKVPPTENAVIGFVRTGREDSSTQYLFLAPDKKYIYETSSLAEFAELKAEIKLAGFSAPEEDSSHIQSLIYQKQVITIETASNITDSVTHYILKASKKNLPRKKDMVFAEHLLMLDSHEYLAEMFGKDNVKPEMFFYAEDDSARCSVLFPNTSREAIFIWQDQPNLRNIEFIIVGGSLRSTQTDILSVQAFNAWRSEQGPYCGMSLQELQAVNGEPLQFFNWNTESAGHLAPRNKGRIDFSKLGLVLACMNCGFIKVSETPVMDSATAIDEMQKVFVTTLVILPGN